jgi:thymidylate kinase
MILDRGDHRVRVEIPALGKGTHVISDRDFLSTLAYGEGEGISWKKLLQYHEDILGNNFIVPDLIIFLDLPVDLGLSRTLKKQDGKKEYFDTVERMVRIQHAYRTIIKNRRITNTIEIVELNAHTDEKTLQSHIWQHVAPKLFT